MYGGLKKLLETGALILDPLSSLFIERISERGVVNNDDLFERERN